MAEAPAYGLTAHMGPDDPGAIGPGHFWIDTTDPSAPLLKIRTTADDGWTTVGAALSYADGLVAGGDIEVSVSSKGLILRSPDATRYRLKVANDGTLSTEVVA